MPGLRANRIEFLFQGLKAEGRKALSAFITAGDPNRETTPRAMHALVEGGADLLELGIPFSDPESDGPAIQAASLRALSTACPTRLTHVLESAREFRRENSETPVVLMGYLNSLLAMGMEAFSKEAVLAGVDGVVLVNLPVEEFAQVRHHFDAVNLCAAFLVAPTTSARRAALISSKARGFVYYVSLKGVTGAAHIDMAELEEKMKRLRSVCGLPIQIGFGIRTPETAAQAAPLADGLIVGTNFVNLMAELKDTPNKIPAALCARAREFRQAMDAACPPGH